MILFTVGAVIGAGIHGIVLLSTTITIIIIMIVLTMVGTDRIVLSTLPTAALLTAMAVVRYLPGTLLHRAGGVRLSAQGLREIRPVSYGWKCNFYIGRTRFTIGKWSTYKSRYCNKQ